MTDYDHLVRATWVGEELEVSFTAEKISSSVYDQGTDEIGDLDQVEIAEIKILGISVLPQDLPNDLLLMLMEHADEVCW